MTGKMIIEEFYRALKNINRLIELELNERETEATPEEKFYTVGEFLKKNDIKMSVTERRKFVSLITKETRNLELKRNSKQNLYPESVLNILYNTKSHLWIA